MVSDQARRELFKALEARLGEGPAGTLMELLPPAGRADVARQSDLVAVRGEIAEVRAEIAELRGELSGEIAKLRGEIKAQVPRLYAANVATMIGLAGLVMAAAKLV